MEQETTRRVQVEREKTREASAEQETTMGTPAEMEATMVVLKTMVEPVEHKTTAKPAQQMTIMEPAEKTRADLGDQEPGQNRQIQQSRRTLESRQSGTLLERL